MTGRRAALLVLLVACSRTPPEGSTRVTATSSPESIGVATMSADGTISLDLRASSLQTTRGGRGFFLR